MRYYLNRTLCDVLHEMRELTKTMNFGAMPALIEEAQSMANRMEGKLNTIRDYDRLQSEVKKLSKEIKALEEKKEEQK